VLFFWLLLAGGLCLKILISLKTYEILLLLIVVIAVVRALLAHPVLLLMQVLLAVSVAS
jgi:hypothetical protein